MLMSPGLVGHCMKGEPLRKKSLGKKRTEKGGTRLVQGQLPQMLGKIKHTSNHHLSQASWI